MSPSLPAVRPQAAARPELAFQADPLDQSELGEPRPGPATPAPLPTAGPPASQAEQPLPPEQAPADLWPLKLRLAERASAMPEIVSGTGADRWAESSDPVTRYLARRALSDGHAGNRLEELCVLYGPVEGSRQRIDWEARFSGFDSERIQLALDRLEGGLQEEPATPAALRSLMLLACKHLRRSREELTPEQREKEPAELDRSLAARACDLLRRYGQVEGDLEAALLEGPVPVRGLKLELDSAPPSTSAEASTAAGQILKQIPVLNERKGVKRLEFLAETMPEQAAEVALALVEKLTAGRPSDEDLSAMARLLSDSRKIPGLARLFEPHQHSLEQVPGRAEALGLQGRGILDFCAALWEIRPPDQEQVTAQLSAILNNTSHDGLNWGVREVLTLMERQPQLAPAIAGETLRQRQTSYPDTAHFAIFGSALKAGWKPDPLEKDWLTSWMVPAGSQRGELSLIRYTFTAPALNLARSLDLDSLVLADPKGELVPYRQALLAHLLESDKMEQSFIPGAKNCWEGAADCFALLAPEPDPALEKRLLDPIAPALATAGRLLDCDAQTRNHLAVLASIPLTPETKARLNELLKGSLPYSQASFEPLVEGARNQVLEQAMAGLKSGDLQERLAAASSCVQYTVQRGDTQEQRDPGELPPHKAALAMVNALPEADRAQVRIWLGSRLAGQESLEKLSNEQLADFVLAVQLARQDPQLEERLRAIAAPESRQLTCFNVRSYAHDHFEQLDRERLSQGVEPEQACALLARIEQTQGFVSVEVEECWARGASGWAGELVERFGPQHRSEARAALTELVGAGQSEQQWHTLQGILTRVELAGLLREKSDAERFQRGLEIWRTARESGDVEQALREHGVVSEPAGSGVLESNSFVAFGGALVRRKNRA